MAAEVPNVLCHRKLELKVTALCRTQILTVIQAIAVKGTEFPLELN